jgi:hypothetical protein
MNVLCGIKFHRDPSGRMAFCRVLSRDFFFRDFYPRDFYPRVSPWAISCGPFGAKTRTKTKTKTKTRIGIGTRTGPGTGDVRPKGARCDSPGCNPGYDGNNIPALKGPDEIPFTTWIHVSQRRNRPCAPSGRIGFCWTVPRVSPWAISCGPLGAKTVDIHPKAMKGDSLGFCPWCAGYIFPVAVQSDLIQLRDS